MKKLFKLSILSLAFLLTACIFNTTKLSFDPIPYEMKVPKEIAGKLTFEPMTGDWVKQIAQAGATAAFMIVYQAEDETKHGFAGIYYMPEDKFDAAANPNEPPLFGTEVSRKDGYVLAIAGPQDSIFEPFTPDGKNITTLYEALYKKETYVKTR